MTKGELIATIATKSGLKNTEATKALEATLNSIIQAVAKEDDVRLAGFGTFTLSKREARKGRNPRTGDTLNIPATRAPRFKPGKQFKEAVA